MLSASAIAQPYRPTDPDQVLVRFDAATRAQAADAARRREVTTSRDPAATLEIAQSYIASGRDNVDERHFGRAEALLRSALPCFEAHPANGARCGRDPLSIELLVTLADVLQHRHEFDGAEAVLNAVLERDRAHAQARLLRATVRISRGRPREALSDCTALVTTASAVTSTACIAHAMSLSGRLHDAYDLLNRILNDESRRADASSAWAFGILAELAERRGDSSAALAALQTALQLDPASFPLRIQAADMFIAASSHQRAMDVLASLPDVEPVLLRRALAARGLKDSARAAQLMQQWKTSSERERELKTPLHLRDLARGQLELLDDAPGALISAGENWRTQREIADARMLIAAASAAGRTQEAQPAFDWLATNKIEDAVFARRTP